MMRDSTNTPSTATTTPAIPVEMTLESGAGFVSDVIGTRLPKMNVPIMLATGPIRLNGMMYLLQTSPGLVNSVSTSFQVVRGSSRMPLARPIVVSILVSSAKVAPKIGTGRRRASLSVDCCHACRCTRPLLSRSDAARRLAGAEREPAHGGRQDRHLGTRGIDPRQLGTHVADLLPVAAGRYGGERCAARVTARARRYDPWLRLRQSELHGARARRNRARSRRGDDRHQAGGEPPGRRSAARPYCRARPRAARARVAAYLAASPPRLAGSGGLRCGRAVHPRPPPSGRRVHPGAHRRRRRLAALTACRT